MAKLFNRILKQFGGHRVELVTCDPGFLQFRIRHFGEFVIAADVTGDLCADELVQLQHLPTKKADWILAVAQGKTRDDAGVMA